MGWFGDSGTDWACNRCGTFVRESELKGGRCGDKCGTCRGKSCSLYQVPDTVDPPEPCCAYCGGTYGEHYGSCSQRKR